MQHEAIGQWRELLPVAYLLTGSDPAARDLLARGLGRGGGIGGLVRVHLRRRFGGDGAIRGTSGAPWWVSPEDAAAAARLADALDTLPPAERTAVVLRWFAAVPVEQVAELVPGVDLAAAAARLAGEVPDPADLPARLEGLAALADTGSVTAEDIELGVRAVRSRRRSRVALAVGAVAVLGVGAAVLPDALPRTPPDARASATASTPPTSAAPDLGPTRGSLADDEEIAAALRDLVGWEPDGGHVVYAGDAAGIRWALLLRDTAGRVETEWFTGPQGADPADLETFGSAYSGGYEPTVWSITARVGAASALLVVARPGDEIDVSPGFDVATDGTAGRTFTPADVEEGVATVVVERQQTVGVVYRISRNDVVVEIGSPSVVLLDGYATSEPLGTARSGTAPVDPEAYASAVGQITSPTGLTEADLDVTVLGAGSYPAPGGATARAVTLAGVLPNGAVVTTTAAVVVDGNGQTSEACGTETHPAGTDIATLTVVTRCASYAGDTSTYGATVLVSAPPGVGVQLNTAAGGAAQAATLDNGWGYAIEAPQALTEFSAGEISGPVSRVGNGPFDSY